MSDILERLKAAERVSRFIAEYRKCHPRNTEIYSLNVDSDREAILLVADIEAVLSALSAKEDQP